MADELKPCPFCGTQPSFSSMHGVWCNNDYCAIVGLVFSGGPRHWNRRAASVGAPSGAVDREAVPLAWQCEYTTSRGKRQAYTNAEEDSVREFANSRNEPHWPLYRSAALAGLPCEGAAVEQERLLDAALEFIKDAPEEEFNKLLEESGEDASDLQRRAHDALDKVLRTDARVAAVESAAIPAAQASNTDVAALLAERDALATENASLRGNCTRMGQDAKQQARVLKRVIRERDALDKENDVLRLTTDRQSKKIGDFCEQASRHQSDRDALAAQVEAMKSNEEQCQKIIAKIEAAQGLGLSTIGCAIDAARQETNRG